MGSPEGGLSVTVRLLGTRLVSERVGGDEKTQGLEEKNNLHQVGIKDNGFMPFFSSKSGL